MKIQYINVALVCLTVIPAEAVPYSHSNPTLLHGKRGERKKVTHEQN